MLNRGRAGVHWLLALRGGLFPRRLRLAFLRLRVSSGHIFVAEGATLGRSYPGRGKRAGTLLPASVSERRPESKRPADRHPTFSSPTLLAAGLARMRLERMDPCAALGPAAGARARALRVPELPGALPRPVCVPAGLRAGALSFAGILRGTRLPVTIGPRPPSPCPLRAQVFPGKGPFSSNLPRFEALINGFAT